MNPNPLRREAEGLRLRADWHRTRARQKREEADRCEDPGTLYELEEAVRKDTREADRLELEAADLEEKAKQAEEEEAILKRLEQAAQAAREYAEYDLTQRRIRSQQLGQERH